MVSVTIVLVVVVVAAVAQRTACGKVIAGTVRGLTKGELVEGKEHVGDKRVTGYVARRHGEVVGVPLGGTSRAIISHAGGRIHDSGLDV